MRHLGAQDRFGEWVKLAELVMVMVPGSVRMSVCSVPPSTSVTHSATGYKHST